MNLKPLPRLEFFDLPVFYKHLDVQYKERSWNSDQVERTTNAVYFGLMNAGFSDKSTRLSDLFNNKGRYYENHKQVLEYFYTELVSTDWVDDVRQHIAQLQQRTS